MDKKNKTMNKTTKNRDAIKREKKFVEYQMRMNAYDMITDEFIITDGRIEMDAFDLFMHSGNSTLML